MPYNTLTIEQRINRCHRQGQQSDVLVVNFCNRNNFADVRMLELINKRILQFSGVFGMSDAVIGNLGLDLGVGFVKVLGKARTKEEIDRAYRDVLQEFEDENKRLVKQATHSLFTSFTKEIAAQVTITPQYIEDKAAELNNDLWALTRWFFEGKHGFRLDEATRTVNCSPFFAAKVFTGKAIRRNEYSMAKGYQPRSGRHTLTGALARGIIGEIFWKGVPERGDIVVDAAPHMLEEPCSVAFYQVRVKPKGAYWGGYDFSVFAGKTRSGKILSDEECRAIMALPVTSFSAHGEPVGVSNRHMRAQRPDDLDALIWPENFMQKALTETGAAEKEEIDRLRAQTANKKRALERGLDALRFQVRTEESKLESDLPRLEKLKLQKQLNSMIRELKQGEQNSFMDSMKLDMILEENIEKFIERARLSVEITRQFVISISAN